ncbi:MAG TPA: FAD-binding oxidoreductase [Candidatus Acidoferrales bacterium]|nr:FAD-binding oxidoreductase [Candidatus Acidoferrales bacterium]
MPNPQFTKPWHGVPREQIHWNPTILEDACIGCGTCVTGCSRLVYRFDFERKKPVVIDPLNCMVGCTTCANTCPAHAIAFPPIETVLAMEGLETVRHAVEDDLLARHDLLAAQVSIPHPDRIVILEVAAIEQAAANVLRVRLKPTVTGECFCEFTPGQYLELWQPESSYMSRAYSIANAPEGDGSVELHIHRVESGRFTTWAFSGMKVGDRLKARGPLGQFTMRSRPDTPLLFVAGGTGFAPILALLRQQIRSQPQRDMVLVWGMKLAQDFYAQDELRPVQDQAPLLRIVLAAEEGTPALPSRDRLSFTSGTATDVLIQNQGLLDGRDIYAAGPAPMLRMLGHQLDRFGIARERVHMDSFSV